MKICGKNSDNRNAKSETNAVIPTLCPPIMSHKKRHTRRRVRVFYK